MMRVIPVNFENVKNGIEIAFQNDVKGFKNYLDPVLVKEVSDIDTAIEEQKCKLQEFLDNGIKLYNYLVTWNDELIGFFIYRIERHTGILVSFGINTVHRTMAIVKIFFSKIKEKTGHPFYCVLWQKNDRAIKWALRMGMEGFSTIQESGHPLVILKG